MNNYASDKNGRIWVLWDTNQATKIRENAQMIHCEVIEKAGQVDYLMTIIYGFNTIEQTKGLWEELKTPAQGINKPWIVIGDFNAVMYVVDRNQGNPVQQGDVQDFANCMQTTNLNELLWKGNYYTWSNKQRMEDRIQSRIDRAFGNYEWMMKWDNVTVEYELPGILDHAPMLLRLGVDQANTRSPFRFFDVRVDHKEFT